MVRIGTKNPRIAIDAGIILGVAEGTRTLDIQNQNLTL